MTLINKIIKDIQYSSDLSIEKIAEEIGYTKEYMFNLMSGKYKESPVVLSLLRERFWDSFTTDLKLDLIMRELVDLKKQLSPVSP